MRRQNTQITNQYNKQLKLESRIGWAVIGFIAFWAVVVAGAIGVGCYWLVTH